MSAPFPGCCRRIPLRALAVAICLIGAGGHVLAQAQAKPAGSTNPPAARTASPQAADGAVKEDLASMAGLWAGGRYKIAAGDVIEVNFPYVSEFNQTVSVQPDGYISLRGLDDIPAAGRSATELKGEIAEAYSALLRDPVVTLVLKEFEKPSVIVGGQVARPGRVELRSGLTLTDAIAVAGGKTSAGRLSDVVLFRRFAADLVEVKRIDVSKMYAKHDLSEDPVLRPGDTIFIPTSTYSKIEPYIPKPSVGFFLNPFYR